MLLNLSFVLAAAILLASISCPANSVAALSCDPQGYASIIGSEVVAVQCVPDGMNDSTC